jgi:hypothetical protein
MPARFRTGITEGIGDIINVGRRGLFLATETLPKPGEAVRIWFVDLHARPVEIFGEVIWTTAEREQARAVRAGFGMRLGHPSSAFQGFLEQLIRG